MLIQPDTFIRLIKKCPLDKTYDHTIYFESEEEQINYFKNILQGIPFNKQSYQRYDKGTLHIQARAEDLYECNYLMFQNSAFGNKYFYAFITSIEYVNNVSSRVKYEIDVMQTWFFNYDLGECFVEREHTLTDNIGDNIIPEKLETGDYVYSPVIYGEGSAEITPFTRFGFTVLATFDKNFEDVKGGLDINMYTGLAGNYFESALDVREFISFATEKQKDGGIVSVYMTPKPFKSGPPSNEATPGGVITGFAEYVKKNHTSIDGYVPRNNKLFTQPYNSLLITNNEGKSANYGFEYFYEYPSVVDNEYVMLEIMDGGTATHEFSLVPWFYKGLEQNHMERVVLTNTPVCSYNIDTFSAWLAHNKISILIDGATEIGGAMASMLGTTYTGVGLSPDEISIGSFDGITNVLKQALYHDALPPTAKGNTGTGALNINTGTYGFSLYYCTIRKQYAKIIDGYFDRYGYAVHEHKIPNRNVRPYWTFVKTRGCTITGSVPSDDTSIISKIYNNGITFWRYRTTDFKVGDYTNPEKNKAI